MCRLRLQGWRSNRFFQNVGDDMSLYASTHPQRQYCSWLPWFALWHCLCHNWGTNSGLVDCYIFHVFRWKNSKTWIDVTHKCFVSYTCVSLGKVNVHVCTYCMLFLHTACWVDQLRALALNRQPHDVYPLLFEGHLRKVLWVFLCNCIYQQADMTGPGSQRV